MINLAKILEEAAEQTGGDVDYRNNYSGRAMYGARCIGLDGGSHQVMELISEVVNLLIQESYDASIDAETDEDRDAAYDLNNETQVAVSKLLKFKEDSMGRGVIYYWPEIQAEEVAETEEESCSCC